MLWTFSLTPLKRMKKNPTRCVLWTRRRAQWGAVLTTRISRHARQESLPVISEKWKDERVIAAKRWIEVNQQHGLLTKNILRVYLWQQNNINCQAQISSAESACRCLISRIARQHGRKPFSWSVFLRFVQVQLYSLALGTSDCHPPVVTVRPDWLNSVGLFFWSPVICDLCAWSDQPRCFYLLNPDWWNEVKLTTRFFDHTVIALKKNT